MFTVIIVGFLLLFALILVILWLIVKRFKIPRKSQRIVYVIFIFILFGFTYWLIELWHDLFEFLGVINSKHYILDSEGNPTKHNTKELITLVFSIFPVLLAAYFINSLLSYFIWEGTLVDDEGQPVVPKIIRSLVALLIYLVALIVIIALNFNNMLNHALVGMGTSGAIGALVAKEPLQKAFTALSLNINKLLKKGDIIQVGGITGSIQEIGWSSVKLLTPEENLAIIPNNRLTQSTVINYSRPEENLLIHINVNAPIDIPSSRIMPLLERSAHDSELVNNDIEPIVSLRHIGQQLKYYTIQVVSDNQSNPLVVKSQVLKSVASMFRRENIIETLAEYNIHNPIEKATKLLNQVPILEPFSDEEDAILAQGAKWLRYSYPERIVIQGETEAALYIVAEGTLDVLVKTKVEDKDSEKNKDKNKTKEETKIIKVAELGTNAIFGEMALLTGEARTATIRATSNTWVCKISKEVMSPILAKNPDILEGLSYQLAKRQIEIERKKEDYDDEMAKKKQKNTATKLFSLMRNFFKEDDEKTKDENSENMML